MDSEARKAAALVAIKRVQAQRVLAFSQEPETETVLRCSDCRFGPVRHNDRDRCEHFVHWQIDPDRKLRIPVTTGQARSPDGLCGPEALLFSPYKWWRLAPRWLARQKPETAAWVLLIAIVTAIALILGLFAR